MLKPTVTTCHACDPKPELLQNPLPCTPANDLQKPQLSKIADPQANFSRVAPSAGHVTRFNRSSFLKVQLPSADLQTSSISSAKILSYSSVATPLGVWELQAACFIASILDLFLLVELGLNSPRGELEVSQGCDSPH